MFPGASLPTVVEQLDGGEEEVAGNVLKDALSHFNGGRHAEAAEEARRALALHSAQEVLASIEQYTRQIIDGVPDVSQERWQGLSEEEVTRHHLADKARELQQWARFLWEASVWQGLGQTSADVAARQFLVEAMERVAAASHLRHLDDIHPEVFAAAIERAMLPGAKPNRLRYYSCISCCEQLLPALVEIPRTLSLGSADVFDAVLFVDRVVTEFLEAALQKRNRVVEALPRLLPRPVDDIAPAVFGLSPQLPQGSGSAWLASAGIRSALQTLRQINLGVLPDARLMDLPLLAAQSVRVVEKMSELCAATLRTEMSSVGAAREPPVRPLKQEILSDLAAAELSLGQPPQCPHRAIRLAEEFADLDSLVLLAAKHDRPKLEHHLAMSERFRLHALSQFLAATDLRYLFFSTIDRYVIQPQVLEELLNPYPEIRWILDVRGITMSSSEGEWHSALERVKQRASSAAEKDDVSPFKQRGLLAVARLAAACA